MTLTWYDAEPFYRPRLRWPCAIVHRWRFTEHAHWRRCAVCRIRDQGQPKGAGIVLWGRQAARYRRSIAG